MEIEDADRLISPRRSHLPLVLGGALVVVVAVAALAAWPSEPDPTRVIVAVRGCDAACADGARAALERVLSSGGFVVEAAAEAPRDAEGLREAAAGAGAEHALFVEVSVHERREAGPIDPAYASASATATLSSVRGEAAVVVSSPRIGAHARELERALAAVGSRLRIRSRTPPTSRCSSASRSAPSRRPWCRTPPRRDGRAPSARRCPASPACTGVRAHARELRARRRGARRRRRALRLGRVRGGVRVRRVTADGAAALVHVETPAARRAARWSRHDRRARGDGGAHRARAARRIRAPRDRARGQLLHVSDVRGGARGGHRGVAGELRARLHRRRGGARTALRALRRPLRAGRPSSRRTARTCSIDCARAGDRRRGSWSRRWRTRPRCACSARRSSRPG
ncbi:MAG: hypothetical protein M5U28_06150 [Sandaracinaceae bacterium]|nr:hypothetical protein [Sandaracinaceae bacterium]